MSWTKAFDWFSGSTVGAGIATGPTAMGAGDAFMLTFSGGAALLGGTIFLVMRVRGGGEVCRLDLPPGPPTAGKLPRAA